MHIKHLLRSIAVACALALPATAFAAPSSASLQDPAGESSKQGKAPTELSGKININEASQKELELLPGIGPSTAKKLVEYRSKQKFAEPIHIMRIKGIGRKTFDAIKPFLTTEGPTTLQKVK